MHNAVRSTPAEETPMPVTEPMEYHATHDPDGAAQLSTTVVHALADVMDVSVTDTGFALFDSIDPDALDRIFSGTSAGRRRSGHVAFAVDGYRVTVYSSGQIVITPPPDHGE